MRLHISPKWIFSRQRRIEKRIFRLAFACCVAAGLLAPGVSCQPKHSVDHAQVTGKMLFKGKPLPGGRLTCLTVNGRFANTGDIDENGNYEIKAPVGDVGISVDNSMLRGNTTRRHLKRPNTEEHAIKGICVRIPNRYRWVDQSGLKYTVKPGPQQFDISLTDTPDSIPEASGK
jgi:hypothetical protein